MPPGCVIGPVNIDVPVARYEFPVISPVPDTLTSVLVARHGSVGLHGSVGWTCVTRCREPERLTRSWNEPVLMDTVAFSGSMTSEVTTRACKEKAASRK